MTAHFLDVCAPGPVGIATEALRTGRHASGRATLAARRSEPRDEEGRLVAISRQLAMVRTRPADP